MQCHCLSDIRRNDSYCCVANSRYQIVTLYLSKSYHFFRAKSASDLAREHLSSHDSLKDARKTKSYNEIETIEAKTKTCCSGSAKHPCEEGQYFLNIEWENNDNVVKTSSIIESSQEREYEDERYEEYQ